MLHPAGSHGCNNNRYFYRTYYDYGTVLAENHGIHDGKYYFINLKRKVDLLSHNPQDHVLDKYHQTCIHQGRLKKQFKMHITIPYNFLTQGRLKEEFKIHSSVPYNRITREHLDKFSML
jgi:hypothetical protein